MPRKAKESSQGTQADQYYSACKLFLLGSSYKLQMFVSELTSMPSM